MKNFMCRIFFNFLFDAERAAVAGQDYWRETVANKILSGSSNINLVKQKSLKPADLFGWKFFLDFLAKFYFDCNSESLEKLLFIQFVILLLFLPEKPPYLFIYLPVCP